MIRQDRLDRGGGGLAIICREDWKIERLDGLFSSDFECLWLRVSTPNSVYYACVVYHPDESLYDQDELLEFLTASREHSMTVDPNCKIIIAGDVNQLKYKDLLVHASLSQMVKKPTRGENIWRFLCPILLICGGRSRSLKVLSGQTTTWLLHVQEHLPRLNVAPYTLEMSENTGKFIWLICLKVIIGKRSFLLLIVN